MLDPPWFCSVGSPCLSAPPEHEVSVDRAGAKNVFCRRVGNGSDHLDVISEKQVQNGIYQAYRGNDLSAWPEREMVRREHEVTSGANVRVMHVVLSLHD
jgi:hypothetical protein